MGTVPARRAGLPGPRRGRGAGSAPLLLLGEGAFGAFHDLLGRFLLAGGRAVVADGANRFDAYRLAGLARGAGRDPREILAAARVSRAFHWRQIITLLEDLAAIEASRTGARAVFALGPLDLLADNDLKEAEVRPAARRAAEALSRLARDGLRVVVAQREGRLREAKRAFLLEDLSRSCRAAPPVRVLEGDGKALPSPGPSPRSSGMPGSPPPLRGEGG